MLERIAAVTDGYKAPWFSGANPLMDALVLRREGLCVNECARLGYGFFQGHTKKELDQ